MSSYWRNINKIVLRRAMERKQKMNEQLISRLKSFSWRFGLFLAVAALGYLSEHVPELGLPEIVTILVVYISNEGTKLLNHKQ